MKTKLSLFIFSAFLLLAILNSCKKEEAEIVPENPYDKIDYGSSSQTDTLDPKSFTYIHRNILLTRCAMPGCHDGNFEPDFRTVQSSYSTLVYHPIVKNDTANSYKYRVYPGDTSKSVLYARITDSCFVNNNDRMPQDNIGVPLPDKDIKAIADWIMGGAKDMYGQTPKFPNGEPLIGFFYATDGTFTIDYGQKNNRVDSIDYNPFYIAQNTPFVLVVPVTDDSTAIQDLINCKVKLSTSETDFSSAVTVTGGAYMKFQTTEFWYFTINPAAYPVGTTVYMRFYCNDKSHVTDTEFPRNDLVFYYRTFWSFKVK